MSGPHNPKKAEIREWGAYVEQLHAAAQAGGGVVFQTKAAMTLGYAANQIAWVIGDPTAANNGIYQKQGASGGGSWVRVGDLPYSFIKALNTGGGTASAIEAVSNVPIPAADGGALINFNIVADNTSSPVTVSFNGGAPLEVKTSSGNEVAVGGLLAGMVVAGYVHGATFRLLSDQASSSIVAAAEVAQSRAEAAKAAAEAAKIAAESAAGANISNADSVAVAKETSIPVPVNYVRAAGYAVAGDGGGALYRRVLAEPSHDGKFQSGDGAWWEVVLENGYARVAWFGTGIAALKKAWSVSKKVICTDGETYLFSPGDTLASTGKSVDIIAPNCIFEQTAEGVAFIDVEGAWLDVQNVAAIAGAAFTLSNGSVFKKGDLVKIIDEQPLPDYVLNGKKGEFATVLGVAGNDVTLTAPTYYTYSTANSCRMVKLNRRLTCKIDVGEARIPDAFVSGAVRLIQAQAFASPDVRVRESNYVPGSAMVIRLASCWGGRAHIGTMYGGSGLGGYGINLTACEYTRAHVDMASGIRHAIDGGSGDNTGVNGFSTYGASAYCEGSGSAYGCTQTPFGTHHGTRQWTYKNCVAVGGAGGCIAFRGVGHRAVDCISYDQNGNFAAFRQYELNECVTNDTTFENCRAVRSSGTFIGSMNGSGNVTVLGGEFEMVAGPTASSRLFEYSDGSLTVKDARIIVKGQVSNRYFNVGLRSTGLTIQNVHMEILHATPPSRIIDNPNAVNAPVKINGLFIDNVSPITRIYGNQSTLGAGSRFGNIVVQGGMTQVVEGLADAALAPYVTGTIYDRLNKKLINPPTT